MKINVLQCQSGRDIAANLEYIQSQFTLLSASSPPQLVVLPECSLLFGGHESEQRWCAEQSRSDTLLEELSNLARRYQVYLVAGTLPVQADDGRLFSRSYLFDDTGQVLTHYDKLHLFDADVNDGTQQYRESDTFCPGEQVRVVDTPFGRIGLAICYDLRFAELFRALRLAGAEWIVLPSAFTKVTGRAHWQVLLQARAIETQCFVVAANQWGQHQGTRETWGHSMVVDPWGEVIAVKPEGTGWLQLELERKQTEQQLQQIRSTMPVMSHHRYRAPILKKTNL